MSFGLAYIETPVGVLRIRSVGDSIAFVKFCRQGEQGQRVETVALSPVIEECRRQLWEYFRGERRKFDLNLVMTGTPFQKKVWKALAKIPYGSVVSYGDIARKIGNEKSCRAVGGANNANPLSIIIPCHRVVGSQGHLVGFGGGVEKKTWLLRNEGIKVVNTKICMVKESPLKSKL